MTIRKSNKKYVYYDYPVNKFDETKMCFSLLNETHFQIIYCFSTFAFLLLCGTELLYSYI